MAGMVTFVPTTLDGEVGLSVPFAPLARLNVGPFSPDLSRLCACLTYFQFCTSKRCQLLSIACLPLWSFYSEGFWFLYGEGGPLSHVRVTLFKISSRIRTWLFGWLYGVRA